MTLIEKVSFYNCFIETLILYVLVIEYYFDKKIFEIKRRKIKRTKNKVVVTVENGMAVVTDKPEGIDVQINTKDN